MKIAVALGSNLGDRLGRLRAAVRELCCHRMVVSGTSWVYETPPFGVQSQPPFLNACICADFPSRDPFEILDILKETERKIGRIARARWDAREIDLDLLFAGEGSVASERLTLPHPGITERPFVLVPLGDVASGWIHPTAGRTIKEMSDECDRTGINRITRL